MKITIEIEREIQHTCPQIVDLLKNVEGRNELERLLDVYESGRAAMFMAAANEQQKREDLLANIPAE